tara:strand:+ start:1562 stop:2017 length:456 start_codon:yes stop_codon:yes gene_type:complete
MNQQEFEKQITRLVEVYGQDRINGGYIREAYRMLKDVDRHDMDNIISLALERCSYPPRLANLRTIQQEVAKTPNDNRDAIPKECCETCGIYKLPGFLIRFVKANGHGYREIHPCPQCNPRPLNLPPQSSPGMPREIIDEAEFEMLNKDYDF